MAGERVARRTAHEVRGREREGRKRGLERNKHTWEKALSRAHKRRFIISSVAKRTLLKRRGIQWETRCHGRPDQWPTNGCAPRRVHATSRVGRLLLPHRRPSRVYLVPRAREPFYASFPSCSRWLGIAPNFVWVSARARRSRVGLGC